MCDIVREPVQSGNFNGADFPHIDQGILNFFVSGAEGYHLPDSAARFFLHMANYAASLSARSTMTFTHVPFAAYSGGFRITTEGLQSLERDMFHLAMSGSLLLMVNDMLRKRHGFVVIMGHCCGADIIPASSERAYQDGLSASHAINIFRGDKLRGLLLEDNMIVPQDEYLDRVEGVSSEILERFFDLNTIDA